MGRLLELDIGVLCAANVQTFLAFKEYGSLIQDMRRSQTKKPISWFETLPMESQCSLHRQLCNEEPLVPMNRKHFNASMIVRDVKSNKSG